MGIKLLTSLVITQGTQTQSYVINICPSHNLRLSSFCVGAQAPATICRIDITPGCMSVNKQASLRQFVAVTRFAESDTVKAERKT